MIAVIFEVYPRVGSKTDYLRIASELRPLLETIDGFISIERFQTLTDPEKLLSLSFWRDEIAIQAWRNIEAHRCAQQQGRSGIFQDYRLRVAHVMRDYGLHERLEAPEHSLNIHR